MDVLDYTKEQLEALDTETLLKLYREAEMMQEQKSTGQLTKKVLINGLYGAQANGAFPLFNEKIAQAITGNGRFFIQKTANMIERNLQSKLPEEKKYVIYGDTDSHPGSTNINILSDGVNKKMTLEDLYDQGYDELEYKPGKFLRKVDNIESLSFNTSSEKLEYKPIVYVMKHRVKKQLFKLRVNGQELTMTCDHCLIVKRNGDYIECKPSEVQKDDRIIIHESGTFAEIKDFTAEDLGIIEEDVYDIEVQDNHNFFGNNILVHNSVYYQVAPFVDLYMRKHHDGNIDFKTVTLEERNKLIEEQVEFCDGFADKVVQPIIDQSIKELSESFNAYNPSRIGAKLEIIAESGIYVAKKKYAVRVRQDEGTRFPIDNPHLKVMGLELAKSTTPPWVKEKLAESIDVILDKTDVELRSYIREIKKEYMQQPLEDIASVQRAKRVDGWSKDEQGVHYGRKMAYCYNKFIKDNNLTISYPEIKPEDRFKCFKLLQPNPFNNDNIGYFNNSFAEKYVRPWIDWDTQFEKTYLASLRNMTDPIGYNVTQQTETLDDW